MVKIYINIWCFKTQNIVKILQNGMLQQLLVIDLVTLVRQRLGASVLFNQYFNLCLRFSMIVTTRFFIDSIILSIVCLGKFIIVSLTLFEN